MKLYIIQSIFILSLITFSSSVKIERLGTLSFKDAILDERQLGFESKGYMCAYLNIDPPLTFFEHSRPDVMDFSVNKAIILTPVKNSSHSEISPLLAFASYYSNSRIEICIIDRANKDPTTTNKDYLSVNYMFITDEALGSNAESAWTETNPPGIPDDAKKEKINVSMDLDIRTTAEYAYLTGVAQHKMNDLEEDVIGHYDVVWLQSMDINSKIASFAWTDTRKNRDYHDSKRVYVSAMAFPITTLSDNGMESHKDYDAGLIPFSWPEEENTIGSCHEITFAATFSFTPFVFTGLQLNMNTESISVTTWVERATEKGAIVCASILKEVTNIERLLKETKETGGLHIYWAAVTHLYTEEELKGQQHLLEVLVSIDSLEPPQTEELQKNLLLDIFKLSNTTIPQDFDKLNIRNVVLGHQSIDMYFETQFEDYIIALNEFFKTLSLKDHPSFIASHKTEENSKIQLQYGKVSVLSPRKITSDAKCTVDQCTEDGKGGTIQLVQSLVSEGKSFNNMGFIKESIFTTGSCNASPCSFSNGLEYHLYDKENAYTMEKYSESNAGLVIGIIVIIILVIAIAFCIYLNRVKTKSFFRRAQAKFHQFV